MKKKRQRKHQHRARQSLWVQTLKGSRRQAQSVLDREHHSQYLEWVENRSAEKKNVVKI